MKKPHQRSLRVRVEYEPDRFSDDCLERMYEQLHPTKSRDVRNVKSSKRGEAEPQKGNGGQR